MQSIYPSVGYSVATSTGVTITIRGSFPATTAKPPTCMFGTVTAPGFYSTTSGGNTTISCTAPAPDDRLSATVPLSFSVDGRNFSPAGANFTFYSKRHDFVSKPLGTLFCFSCCQRSQSHVGFPTSFTAAYSSPERMPDREVGETV